MKENDVTTMFGKGWAQPVVSKRWAFIATVTHALQRATGHRLDGKYAHRAWERACALG